MKLRRTPAQALPFATQHGLARLHRAFGYAWVTLMVVAAVSALFIRDYNLPNIAGYTPIHLLVPLTLSSLVGAFRALAQGNIALHRKIGKVYVVSVLLSGLAGVYIGFFATGGIVASLGFICLGLTWLYTTLQAYRFIRNRNTESHRKMMIYSYAACFAAVTLRLWLPMLTALFHDFKTAYRIVAWLCWLPNLAVARYILIK